MNVSWYAARAAGLVAWTLSGASVVLGLVMATSAFGRRPTRAWKLDLHRYLGTLAVAFTGVHVGAILVDSFVHFSLVDVLVPFASAWHPAAVAGGVVALWLLVAVEVTSLLRHRMNLRTWHRVHLLSFPLFALATVHGLAAGTDASGRLAAWAVLGVLAAIAFVATIRVLEPRPANRPAANEPVTRRGSRAVA